MRFYICFKQEDYKLLETMNKVTMQKYASYRQIASDVGKQIIELNEKCNMNNIFITLKKRIFIYIIFSQSFIIFFYIYLL